MAHSNKVGLGRVTISSLERPVLVEPRGAGLVMSIDLALCRRSPAEFGAPETGEADPIWLPIAETIIERRSGAFEPASFRDRYQDALRELVEAKTKGLVTAPRTIAKPPKVINLMDALKRSLAQDAEPGPKKAAASRPTRTKAVPDRR